MDWLLEFGSCSAARSRRRLGVSLLAMMHRLIGATAADIPITSSDFWQNEDECTEEVLKHVFRSATEEEMPMFQERVACLREAGQVLYEVCRLIVLPFDCH
jgi:hypothetical protein